MQQELNDKTSLSRSGVACRKVEISKEPARAGYLRLSMIWQCPASGDEWMLGQSVLLEAVPGHIHFARFILADGSSQERLFTRRSAQQQLNFTASTSEAAGISGSVWAAYTLFGFEHILIGVDHIAFLLGLLLLTRRLMDVILVVTGFTLGHSVTLALTVLGLVTPEQSLVEGLIGFTIALVALENVLDNPGDHRRAAIVCLALFAALAAFNFSFSTGPPPLSLLGVGLFCFCYLQISDSPAESQKLRPMLTLLFGLIHGFGFASVLIEVGLPEDQLLASLLAFNIGVELGQIAIVVVLATIAFATQKLTANRSIIETTLNAGLCGLGVFWFVERLY